MLVTLKVFGDSEIMSESFFSYLFQNSDNFINVLIVFTIN